MPITNDRLLGTSANAAIKLPCRVATTAAITLSGLQTIDGVALADGDRVLVWQQADATENGIYEATTSAWQRPSDANGNGDFVRGGVVNVYAGTAQQGWYEVATADPVLIGTSSISFNRWLLTAG